jgi:hypothetical protein
MIAISIQADKVITDISDVIAKQAGTLFPKKRVNNWKMKENRTKMLFFHPIKSRLPSNP